MNLSDLTPDAIFGLFFIFAIWFIAVGAATEISTGPGRWTTGQKYLFCVFAGPLGWAWIALMLGFITPIRFLWRIAGKWH